MDFTFNMPGWDKIYFSNVRKGKSSGFSGLYDALYGWFDFTLFFCPYIFQKMIANCHQYTVHGGCAWWNNCRFIKEGPILGSKMCGQKDNHPLHIQREVLTFSYKLLSPLPSFLYLDATHILICLWKLFISYCSKVLITIY